MYYYMRCLLTIRDSQILSSTILIPEIKRILCQKYFSLHYVHSKNAKVNIRRVGDPLI